MIWEVLTHLTEFMMGYFKRMYADIDLIDSEIIAITMTFVFIFYGFSQCLDTVLSQI